MSKYEYRKEKFSNILGSLVSYLNQMEREGWELESIKDGMITFRRVKETIPTKQIYED